MKLRLRQTGLEIEIILDRQDNLMPIFRDVNSSLTYRFEDFYWERSSGDYARGITDGLRFASSILRKLEA